MVIKMFTDHRTVQQFVFLCVNTYVYAKVSARINRENTVHLVLQGLVQYINFCQLNCSEFNITVSLAIKYKHLRHKEIASPSGQGSIFTPVEGYLDQDEASHL